MNPTEAAAYDLGVIVALAIVTALARGDRELASRLCARFPSAVEVLGR